MQHNRIVGTLGAGQAQCRDAIEATKLASTSIRPGQFESLANLGDFSWPVAIWIAFATRSLTGQYTLTEHAYDEMDEDHLDVLDVASAILTGEIDKVLTVDPRGTRFVVIGNATDEATPVAVVVRFVEHDRLLIITVYEIK